MVSVGELRRNTPIEMPAPRKKNLKEVRALGVQRILLITWHYVTLRWFNKRQRNKNIPTCVVDLSIMYKRFGYIYCSKYLRDQS